MQKVSKCAPNGCVCKCTTGPCLSYTEDHVHNDNLCRPEAWGLNCGLQTDVTASILSSCAESKRSATQLPVKRQQQVNKPLANSSGPLRSRRSKNKRPNWKPLHSGLVMMGCKNWTVHLTQMGLCLAINTPIVYCVARTLKRVSAPL